MLNITKEVQGDKVLVKLEGRLDTTTAPDLDEALQPIMQESNAIELDISELAYVSSAGLRSFLCAHKIMKKKGGMTVSGVVPDVMEVFRVTGFNKILNLV